jgi:hypothetical protein
MVLSGGRLAKETNNDGGVKDFTVTPVTDEDDKIHNAQDVNVVNSGDDALATAANQTPPTDILKADETDATTDTNVVTITQTGIKEFRLSNPSSTITMYVNFGADPSANNQIVLPPLTSYDDSLKTIEGDMRYKSSAAGGTLVYVLKG